MLVGSLGADLAAGQVKDLLARGAWRVLRCRGRASGQAGQGAVGSQVRRRAECRVGLPAACPPVYSPKSYFLSVTVSLSPPADEMCRVGTEQPRCTLTGGSLWYLTWLGRGRL